MNATIIKNVTVIDPANDDPYCPGDIIIEGETIRDLGRAPSAMGEARVIDGRGLFALPGLIDAHTHSTLADLNLRALGDVPQTLMAARAANILKDMVMRGFTSVRDAAGADWGIRQAIEEGEITGPRMYISGRALSQTGGHGDVRARTDTRVPCACESALAGMTEFADGTDEVRKAVRELFRQGADQIKVMASGGVASPNDPLDKRQYSVEELEIIVEEAIRRGSYVMAHAYDAGSIATAVDVGIRSIEHGNLVDATTARQVREKGAFAVPTLSMPDIIFNNGAKYGLSPYTMDKLNHVREAGYAAIPIWKEAGVPLGFGTDLLGDTYAFQSREFLLRAEIETPRDVIRSATTINAQIMQQQGKLGVIAPGAYADLLLIDGDPLEDLSLLQDEGRHLKLIMKGGQVLKNALSS